MLPVIAPALKLRSGFGLIIVVFLLCAACAGCSARHAAVSASSCDVQPHAVRVLANLRYGSAGDLKTLDLFVPEHRAGEPLVVFVHGGGWIGGDKRSYEHVGYAYARCGIAFASINYPLAPRARADVQADVVLQATHWLLAHAPLYGFASDRIFLMGHSAGAELVTLAALRRAPSTDKSGLHISGVIALDGFAYQPVADFPASRNLANLPGYYAAAFGADKARWPSYDVTHNIRGHEPAFVIVHGLDDTYVPAQDSQRLAHALTSAGITVTYLEPSGLDHNTVIGAMIHGPADPTAQTIQAFIFGNGSQPAIAAGQSRELGAAWAAGIPSPLASPSPRLPRPDHVVMVIEENHAFSSIIGNSQAPYMNKLANNGLLLTQSYAVTHPSQPNYVALFAGQINSNGDGCPERKVPANAPNLGSELIAAGFSFAGYSETMPRAGFTGCWAGFAKWSYARKHNPWVNFSNIPPASNQPFKALPKYENLPTLAIIVPNQAHDMHSGSIEDADEWLQKNLGALIDWSATHNTLFILTWDEDDREESNHIPTIFVGPMVKTGRYDAHVDHYGVLRTLEDMYGLTPTANARNAPGMTGWWR